MQYFKGEMSNVSNWTQSVALATEDKGAYCHSNQDERFLIVLSKSIALFLILLTSNKENTTKKLNQDEDLCNEATLL